MKSWEKGMYLNQKDLIYIKTIVDEGGITQAARKLFVSQPSLSQSVKRIEESLGTDLFRRTPKGLILTPEGEEYYHMANKVMHIYESFDEEIHNLKEFKTGIVTVGATPHRGMHLFPKFLAEFYMKYPGIQVNVIEATTDELEKMVLNGTVDLAALREPAGTGEECSFDYHGIAQDSFLVLLPKGHHAGTHAEGEKKEFLDPKWLKDETFLLPAPHLRLYENVMSILKMAGISAPKCGYRAFYMETLIHLATSGAGVAIVSEGYWKYYAKNSQCDCYRIPESYGTFWEVSLATLKDAYLSRAAQKFMDEYTNWLGNRD